MKALGIAGFELEKNLGKSLRNPADITYKKMIWHHPKQAGFYNADSQSSFTVLYRKL